MRFPESLIPGYGVVYVEHRNIWQLDDNNSNLLFEAPSLEELRLWVKKSETKEKKHAFTRIHVFYYERWSGFTAPMRATVTSRVDANRYWISYTDRQNKPRRSVVEKTKLFEFSPLNIAVAERLEAISLEIEELEKERQAKTNQLTPLGETPTMPNE